MNKLSNSAAIREDSRTYRLSIAAVYSPLVLMLVAALLVI